MYVHDVQVEIVEYTPNWAIIVPVALASVAIVAFIALALQVRKRRK